MYKEYCMNQRSYDALKEVEFSNVNVEVHKVKNTYLDCDIEQDIFLIHKETPGRDEIEDPIFLMEAQTVIDSNGHETWITQFSSIGWPDVDEVETFVDVNFRVVKMENGIVAIVIE